MTREYYARHPDAEECRVPVWESTSRTDRALIMRAIRAALLAANDEAALARFSEMANSSQKTE